jgi:glycerol-3-phosphate cytidylyltransferase-like family protein
MEILTKDRPHLFHSDAKYLVSSGGLELGIAHIGHAKYLTRSFELAKELGLQHLIVVNGDSFIRMKHSREPILSQQERAEIVSLVFPNSKVVVYDDSSLSIAPILDNNNIRAKAVGGEFDFNRIPKDELEVCIKNNIEILWGLGGYLKLTSTTKIIERVLELCQRN